MSVLTTTPLKVAPAAANDVALTNGTRPTWGAWVELISATAAPIAIAGLQWSGGSYSLAYWDLDVGIGAAGAETSVGTFRLFLENSGSDAIPYGWLLPVPLGGIGSGVRVAVRGRVDTGASGPAGVALSYYENLSSDQVTTSGQTLTYAPQTPMTLTPSATPWANSPWGELIPDAPTGLGLLGLVHRSASGSEGGVEYDLGTGGSGSEVVITTLRDVCAHTNQRSPYTWLPGIYPIPVGTRVVVRMRKAGTATTAHPVALLYYTNVSAFVTVPNVVGMTEAAAGAALGVVGLVTGTVTMASNQVVPAGQIISQSPIAGTLVAPGSAVAIVVSTGAHDYTWQIKDLTGATRWMTGLLVFPVEETTPPIGGGPTPGQVVIPMLVVTRVVFPSHLDGVPDDCCCR